MRNEVRRIVAGASALLVLHTAVLRAGMLCGAAVASAPVAVAPATNVPHHEAMAHSGHMGHGEQEQAPAPTGDHSSSHHGDVGHCALMAACAQASLVAPATMIVADVRARDAVQPGVVATLVSFTAAPDTPPPRA